MNNPIASTFKRVLVGSRFVSNQNGTTGQSFRKASAQGAFRLKANGVGETHAQVKFSRSAPVSILN